MSEPPDPETLARRFLDLWQDQMTAVAGDPQLAEAMTRWIGMSAPAMAAFLPMMQAGMQAGLKGKPLKEETLDTTGRDGTGAAPPSARAAASAAASGGRGLDLDECARRLAAVEERLARLEAGAGGSGKGAQAKPSDHRS